MFVLRNCASCNILWTLTRGSCRGVCVPGKVRGPFKSRLEGYMVVVEQLGDRRNAKAQKKDEDGREEEEEGVKVGEWCAHVLDILRVSPWGMECVSLRVAWILCTEEEQRISNFSILLFYYSRSCSSEVESTISGCPHLLAI